MRPENGGDPTDHDAMERLHRACQIAVVTKGKNPLPTRLSGLVSNSCSDAFSREYLHGFYQAADIDLDFSISPAADIAKQAEALAAKNPPSASGHLSLAMLELATRAYRDAGDTDNENRLTAMAAEWCVGCADTLTNAPMLEAHWLTRAIAIYGRVRAEKVRRNELRKRLIDVQTRTLDELAPIGHSVDISEIVKSVQDRISGQPLAKALRALILASKSPSPETLKSEAQAAIKKSPLSSLFSTQVLDNDGKVKFTSPGMGGGSDANQEATVRFQIMQQEGIRRNILVKSTLDPARAIINAEHGITADKLLPLVQATPFVPPGYEFVFAQGLARWFGGDPISATSILVPQLENSLRYILKNAGEDVSTMKNDGTQEDRSIQALFDQMRGEIERVLGQGITYEIENVFLFRAGPGVRHGIAHGQFSTGHFYSNDSAYACWFIFHLCFLPLLSNWGKVEEYLNSN